jgi:hypothetical protein
MKNKISYRISQLHKVTQNSITGAMSPMLAAKELGHFLDTDKHKVTLTGLWRIDWRKGNEWDELMLQEWDGKHPSHTYYDMLVAVYDRSAKLFFIDRGVNICPVALSFGGESNVTFTEIYYNNSHKFIDRPTYEMIIEIMNKINCKI